MKNLTNKLITICVVSIFVFCLFGKSTQTSIIKKIDNNINLHNHIRSLIFPPLQLPKFGKKFIIKSIFKNKKIQLKFKR